MEMHLEKNIVTDMESSTSQSQSSTSYRSLSKWRELDLPLSDWQCQTCSKTMITLYSLIVTIIISTRLLLPFGLTDPNPAGGTMILQTTRRGLQRNES